jgi:hypothetical protein
MRVIYLERKEKNTDSLTYRQRILGKNENQSSSSDEQYQQCWEVVKIQTCKHAQQRRK